MKSDKPLLDLLRGKELIRNPIWLMRQAGRYLPEYRELRKQAGSFLNLCLNPELAAEVTLQPIRRFGFDAAILFADILLVPYGLEQSLTFKEGEGPVLEPITTEKELSKLLWNSEALEPVFQTLRLVKKEIPDETTLIGFAGAPWTVASYMIEGRGKTGFTNALKIAENNPRFMQRLLKVLHQATLEYLGRQIEAGAEVLQIFDSWAGLLNDVQFRQWVIAPTKKLVKAIKAEYPNVPIIGFPRGVSAENYYAYVAETGVDALSIDQNVPADFAIAKLQRVKPLQGNLAPELLVAGGETMRKAVTEILQKFGPSHIFNLGHGVVPETPPEHVAELVQQVRNWKA